MKHQWTEGKIVFTDLVAATLFSQEICGQISDGLWENASPMNHWEGWSVAEVIVDPKAENVGTDFYPRKDNYNLLRSDLMEYVGDRMLVYMNLAIMYPEVARKAVDLGERLPDSISDMGFDSYKKTADACGLTPTMLDMVINHGNFYGDKGKRELRNHLREVMRTMRTRLPYEPKRPTVAVTVVPETVNVFNEWMD